MKNILKLVGIIVFWLSWPILWVYLRRGTRTRIIVSSGQEIVVVKGWISAGRWGLPGGGLHKGETPMRGVLRELKEETGIILSPAEVKERERSVRATEHGLSFTYTFFEARLPAKPPLKKQRIEIAEAAWMPLADLLVGKQLSKEARHALESWSQP